MLLQLQTLAWLLRGSSCQANKIVSPVPLRQSRVQQIVHVFSCADRDQLRALAKLLEQADNVLSHHLRQIGAGECFFAYRMFIVQLRREMPLNQAGLLCFSPLHLAEWSM
jgi:hypothetical protein